MGSYIWNFVKEFLPESTVSVRYLPVVDRESYFK